jgi:hypothetical protein
VISFLRFDLGMNQKLLWPFIEAVHHCTVRNPAICYAKKGYSELQLDYFGAREATIFSKHGSPRSGSQNGNFSWPKVMEVGG